MDTEDTRVVQWLEENQEDSYRLEVRGDGKLASIFMVPKTMKGNDVIYTPRVISMGLYHFLTPHLAEMESEKSKIIARAVMNKLPPNFFTPLQMIRQGGGLSHLQEDNFFGGVIHGARDYYGDAKFLKKLNEETFAMMLFRDSSFLLVFLAHYVANKNGRPYQQQSHSHGGSPFHGLKSGKGVYLDVIKLENQIPLSALKSLHDFIGDPNQRFEDFVAQICSYYSPFWIQPSEDSDLVSKFHLLHCLHATVYSKSRKAVGKRLTNGWFPFTWLKNHSLCLRRNSSYRNSKRVYKKKQDPSRLFGSNVLPSTLRLSKAGVKFRHYEGGIEQIRFDKARSTLYLPVLKIGIMTETIIRNLIVFELCSSESEENAVTSFVRLLEELTVDAKDAELLRRNGILVNWVGGDDKMVEIVKSLSSSTWKPYFKPVNDARSSLKTYYSTRTWKILWSEFLDTSCSKPWVLISAVAAAVLLVMTALQILCLFYTCNKNA
ncbi:hypothetical protein SUGI_0916980 [Cryptomeria japonica]|uniref:uncharacterized protein LOC131034452 n=1 Tax=Cryptomeria japonica TaxID=3369 RepID=UPI002414C6C6|nr:uncharacterized protein LOC131034452 [Cryptomeria japonica]GLJ43984.1 hypothetical protein SUGI_0916980 [Cryptomeria japonica]